MNTRRRPAVQARRERERVADQHRQERNRQRAKGGGQPNELGITQGQNAEQGNTVEPRNAPRQNKIVEH